MARLHPKDIPAVHQLISDIQALENRAHRLKMVKSGHALNAAKNAVGWEFAEQTGAIAAEACDSSSKRGGFGND